MLGEMHSPFHHIMHNRGGGRNTTRPKGITEDDMGGPGLAGRRKTCQALYFVLVQGLPVSEILVFGTFPSHQEDLSRPSSVKKKSSRLICTGPCPRPSLAWTAGVGCDLAADALTLAVTSRSEKRWMLYSEGDRVRRESRREKPEGNAQNRTTTPYLAEVPLYCKQVIPP